MSDNNNMVKKESVFYALIFGLVVGFIGGAVFAVYKLGPETTVNPPVASNAPQAQNQGQAQLNAQTQEAITNLEADVTANPDNVESWTRLGHLYYDSGQIEGAIKAYDRSLELQPGNPDVWTDLGVMYRRNKQPQKAIDAFEHAFSIQPSHEVSRINKGIVLLYDLNKPEETIVVWEELYAMNPNAKMPNNSPLIDAINEVKDHIKADQ